MLQRGFLCPPNNTGQLLVCFGLSNLRAGNPLVTHGAQVLSTTSLFYTATAPFPPGQLLLPLPLLAR